MAFSCSGASPLENVATICPLGTGEPQLSTSRTLSGVGHEAGWEKAATRPVCVGTSCVGEQPEVCRG